MEAHKRLITDGKAFYGSRISENILVTPEGFLICKSVPISRTGEQEYLGDELGLEEYSNQLVTVVREESEVFNPKAMASFEGKPFTDDHPPSAVTSKNYNWYLKGHAANIRRGEGEDSDNLIADLFIYDPQTIQEIMKNGKREISCGYDCDYAIKEDGRIYQVNIRGNHIALVDEGRAGHSVRIKDNKPKLKKGVYGMKKTDKSGVIAKLISCCFSKDAEPEEVAEVISALTENNDDEPDVELKQADEEPDLSAEPAIGEVLKKLCDNMEEIKKDMAAIKANDEAAADPLRELEEELKNQVAADDDETEKSVSEMDEEGLLDEEPDEVSMDEDEITDEEPTEDDEIEADEEPAATMDKKALLRMIRAIRPAVAQMKDKKQKKIVTDALTTLAKSSFRRRTNKTNNYSAILGMQKKNALKRAAFDSKVNRNSTQVLGKKIAESRNPHYKKQ